MQRADFTFPNSHLPIKCHLSFTKDISDKWRMVNNLANGKWKVVNEASGGGV